MPNLFIALFLFFNASWAEEKIVDLASLTEQSQQNYSVYSLGGRLFNGKVQSFDTDWEEKTFKHQEGTLKAGKKHGTWMEWYSNGHKKAEYNYKAGILDGPYQSWNNPESNVLEMLKGLDPAVPANPTWPPPPSNNYFPEQKHYQPASKAHRGQVLSGQYKTGERDGLWMWSKLSPYLSIIDQECIAKRVWKTEQELPDSTRFGVVPHGNIAPNTDKRGAYNLNDKQKKREQVIRKEGELIPFLFCAEPDLHQRYRGLSNKDMLVHSAIVLPQKNIDNSRIGELYAQGRPYGVLQFYLNGQKRVEKIYDHDSETFSYTEWLENGEMFFQSSFAHQENRFQITEWYKNGQKSVETVVNGNHLSMLQWYENGQLKKEADYTDIREKGKSKKTGSLKTWYENGQQSQDINYGEYTTKTRWHDNGQKSIACIWIPDAEGVPKQQLRQWLADGTEVKPEAKRRGRLRVNIEETAYNEDNNYKKVVIKYRKTGHVCYKKHLSHDALDGTLTLLVTVTNGQITDTTITEENIQFQHLPSRYGKRFSACLLRDSKRSLILSDTYSSTITIPYSFTYTYSDP
jgi:antitoxin component YwqK of YwqJK toxin-antitoxin module